MLACLTNPATDSVIVSVLRRHEQCAGIPCLASERGSLSESSTVGSVVSSLIYMSGAYNPLSNFAGVRAIRGVPQSIMPLMINSFQTILCCWASMHDVRVESNHRRTVNIRSKTVYARVFWVNIQWESALMWFHCLQWQWYQFCFQMVPVFS